MDQDLQGHEEESTRDLRLSRWRVPTLAAVLIVNLCLVTLAIGRPVGRTEHRIPVAAVAPEPASPQQANLPPAITGLPPAVATVEPVSDPLTPADPAPAEPPPVERVTIVPDIDLPPEPVPVEQPMVMPLVAAPPTLERHPFEPAPLAPRDPAPIDPASAGSATDDPPLLPRNELPSLVIVNPPQSGGPIHFAIDGTVCTLLPGEYHRLPVAESRHVEYHRGDEFDYAQHELTEGVHQFTVGETGWTLILVERDKATRLIETCRAIAK
jgi:hypothetical protein